MRAEKRTLFTFSGALTRSIAAGFPILLIILIHVASHGFVPLSRRPRTALEVPPRAQYQYDKDYCSCNFPIDSHSHDTTV
jgi:hypothetical protein